MLQNRAQAATELLQELNSDVSGNFVEEVGIAYLNMVLQFFSRIIFNRKWKP